MARPLTRRIVLQRTAAASATALALPSFEAHAAASDAALADLEREVASKRLGEVVRPGSAAHGRIKYYNARFDCRRATTYVRPTSTEGVQHIIAWANRTGRTFAIRGGGHSFEGKSSHPDLVVDMARMTGLRLGADGVLQTEAGVLLGDVYKKLTVAGSMLPAGTCPTVGIVGHALGGGIGDFLPIYGYTAQSLTSVTLVTLAGDVVTVDDTQMRTAAGEPFSPGRPGNVSARAVMTALRGGGQGTLGIVTEMTFKTHSLRGTRLGTFVLSGAPSLGADRALRLLETWQSWREGLPEAVKSMVGSKLNLGRSGNSYSIDIAGLIAVPPGATYSLDDVARALDPLFAAVTWEKRTLARDVSPAKAVASFVDDDDTTSNPRRRRLYGSSSVLPSALPRAALEVFLKQVPAGVYVSLYTSGGATKTGPEISLAPSEFLVEWVAWTGAADKGLYDRVRRANFAMLDAAGLTSKNFGMPNYCDHGARDYFPNQAGLERLRAAFDPNGLSTSSLVSGPAAPNDRSCG